MKAQRSNFTPGFEKEVVRLVRGGLRQAEVVASLGLSGQTPRNWVKADDAGRLTERDILKKATAYFARESR